VLNVTRHCSQTKSQQNTTGTTKKTEHKQNTNKNYQAIYLIFFPVFGFLVKNGLVFFFFFLVKRATHVRTRIVTEVD